MSKGLFLGTYKKKGCKSILIFDIKFSEKKKKKILGYISLDELFYAILRVFEKSKFCALGLLMHATTSLKSNIFLKYSLVLEWNLFKLIICFFQLQRVGSEMVNLELLDAMFTENATTG